MNLISGFVHNPVKVSVGVILVCLFGVLSMLTMPMQLIPEVQTPTLTIETRWPGRGPEEVEREVVLEQEKQLKGVEGVTKMTAECYNSVGRIILEFPVGTNIQEAIVKVNTRLQQVPSYPEDVDQPVITTSNASDSPIAWFILTPRMPSEDEIREVAERHPDLREGLEHVLRAEGVGLQIMRLRELAQKHPILKDEIFPDTIDISTMRKYAEDVIESSFERVTGVANANVLGGREEEIQVVIDPEKLAARKLTIQDVRLALRGQNADTSAGDFWQGKRSVNVRTLGKFRDPRQVEAVIITRRDGVPIYIRDIGRVVEGFKKPDGFVRRYGTNCIAINAQRAIGANVLDVMEGLRKATAALNAGPLKSHNPQLQLSQVYDETDYIKSARDVVTENLITGSIFTFITLLLFLRSGISTVIIFVHILVSTIGAFLVMKVLGRSLNVPALGGLAFAVGMLVDNAIVMLENIYRRRQMGESPETAAVRGAGEVWGALLNATIANLAVFLPVLFVKDEAGQLFRDIAIAICAAVALSMLVAVTVVPTAAMRLLAPGAGNPRFGWAGRLLRPGLRACDLALRPVYWSCGAFVRGVVAANRLINASVLLRAAVIVSFLAAAGWSSWVLLPKAEYLPNGNRNLVFASILPPPGYNLQELTRMGEFVESELRPYWDIDRGQGTRPKYSWFDPSSWFAAVPAGEKKPPEIADFFFVARSRSVFIGTRAVDPQRAAELVPLIMALGPRLPGTILVAFQTSLFERGLSGGRRIDIEITGPDIHRLVQIGAGIFAAATEKKLGQVRPVPSLDLSNPELHVIPKWEQAADLQVTAADLGYSVDAYVDGAYATDYFKGSDKVDLRIVGEESLAARAEDIKMLPIATPTGELVPLQAVALVVDGSGPEQINHLSRQRTITISVTPPETLPVEAAMEIIQNEIVQPLIDGGALEGLYQITLGGTADKLTATRDSMGWNLVLAIVITYLLMAATFESWLYPFVVITTVMIGFSGGFAGLWILNLFYLQKLDVLTMLGFIMLVGTVVNNPILIVEQTLIHLREDGMDVRSAVLESLRNRIRPIFMTTLGGLVGLLPLVIAPGAGSELYRGIGAVLLGGLFVSTIVTLVYVPALLTLTIEASAALTRLLYGAPSAAAAEPPAGDAVPAAAAS